MEPKLMPHQQEGVDFIIEKQHGVLAFDPGCGKTLTALTALKKLGCKRNLIVAPVSILSVWKDEIEKWYPGTPVTILKAAKPKRDEVWKSFKDKASMGWVVVSYETLRLDFKGMRDIEWHSIVLDESYKIQSPTAKVTKSILALKAVVRIALNGTLISNGYQDLWAQCHFVAPGCLYTNFYQFRAMHAIMHPHFPAIKAWRNVEDIKRRAWPHILFKKKEEVLKDLPAMTEQTISFDLSPQEKKAYRQIKEELALTLLDGEDMAIPNILVQLMRLRQVTNGLFTFTLGDSTSSKLDAMEELLQSIPPDKKVIIFSSFKETINEASKRMDEATKYVITGETPSSDREEIVKNYRESDKPRTLLFGTDAMAYGLNLQCASYVVNLDLPWSYAKYEQRIGRAWRQGQTQPVTVYNMEATGTVDGHVAKILDRKVKTADDFSAVTMQDITDILS